MYIPPIGKKSKITPVPTVFFLRHYQLTNNQEIVPPKEYCRHRCNFRFLFIRILYTGQSFIN